MISVIGYNGILAQDLPEGAVAIALSNDIIEAINFIKDLQTALGTWNGYALAADIKMILDNIQTLKDEYESEQKYRLTNPAVGEAYRQYRIMLALAKEDSNAKNV